VKESCKFELGLARLANFWFGTFAILFRATRRVVQCRSCM